MLRYWIFDLKEEGKKKKIRDGVGLSAGFALFTFFTELYKNAHAEAKKISYSLALVWNPG